MSDTKKVFTCEEVKELCRDAFKCGDIYGSESTRYGIDAVAYDWKHWLKRHAVLSSTQGAKTEPQKGQEHIHLKRRYPNSLTEDITDAFIRGYSRGYEVGYDAGYNEATEHCYSGNCRQVHECVNTILDEMEERANARSNENQL